MYVHNLSAMSRKSMNIGKSMHCDVAAEVQTGGIQTISHHHFLGSYLRKGLFRKHSIVSVVAKVA